MWIQTRLRALIALQNFEQPASTADVRAFDNNLDCTTSTMLNNMVKGGYAKRKKIEGFFHYTITTAGKLKIEEQLALAPLEQHPVESNRGKPSSEPPALTLNTSVTADQLSMNIAAVMHENATLRDTLASIRNIIDGLIGEPTSG